MNENSIRETPFGDVAFTHTHKILLWFSLKSTIILFIVLHLHMSNVYTLHPEWHRRMSSEAQGWEWNNKKKIVLHFVSLFFSSISLFYFINSMCVLSDLRNARCEFVWTDFYEKWLFLLRSMGATTCVFVWQKQKISRVLKTCVWRVYDLEVTFRLHCCCWGCYSIT